MNIGRAFAAAASKVAKLSGRPLTFLLAGGLVVVWAATGPAFGYSNAWQLVMNTVSSIVTFLMVFLIQNDQARNSEAVQAKLDEIIHALGNTDARLIAIERLPDYEIEQFRTQHGPVPKQPNG